MDHHESSADVRSRRKKRSSRKKYYFLFAGLALVAVVLFLLLGKDTDSPINLRKIFGVEDSLEKGNPPPKDTGKVVTVPDASNTEQEKKTGDSSLAINEVTVVPGSINDGQTNADKGSSQLEDVCIRECTKIETFYSHLDQQPYMKAYKLPQPSKEYFTELIRKLAQHPPVVNRETDDLFTILKNTAHFFRIIGKDNITIIKSILDQEKDSLENTLAALYALTDQPDCLKTRLGLEIPAAVFYDYSGFFLNTMGGRLYLFRRDSVSRMVVSYYAIRLIDRSNQEGANSHGIDIRPAIAALIPEIENSGNQLKLKEDYLDELYALKEKYPSAAEQ
jgi:hypothetical protein